MRILLPACSRSSGCGMFARSRLLGSSGTHGNLYLHMRSNTMKPKAARTHFEPMNLHSMAKLLLLLSLLPFAISEERTQLVSKRIPIHVTTDGRSEFKKRLSESLKKAFRSSPDFSLNRRNDSDALSVSIRSYLDWKDGSEISCTVEFSSGPDKLLGISVASCRSGDLAKCTSQILKDAHIAAKFLAYPTPEAIPTTITEIKANPMKYDERVVRLTGYFSSGHHGVSLDTRDHNSGIRLRWPGADEVLCPVPVDFDNVKGDHFRSQ